MKQKQRRAEVKKAESDFYEEYIRHLPQVPLNEPLERGRLYHTVVLHDDWCDIYSGKDCNCIPVITRYVEPQRS